MALLAPPEFVVDETDLACWTWFEDPRALYIEWRFCQQDPPADCVISQSSPFTAEPFCQDVTALFGYAPGLWLSGRFTDGVTPTSDWSAQQVVT